MKAKIGVVLLGWCGWAWAVDLQTPKTVHSDQFQSVLYAENGAFQCRDKFQSSFGDSPGHVWIENGGGRYGKRLRDDAGRTANISSFQMQLPDAVGCKDLDAKIPRGNDWVTVNREIQAYLRVGSHTELILKEVARIPIAEGLELEGSFEWVDFVVPNNAIDPRREIVLQFLDRDSWETSDFKKLRFSKLSCQPSRLFADKHLLTVQVWDASPNVYSVARTFESKAECQDSLSELEAELEVGQDWLNQEVHLKRSLTLKKNSVGRLYRTETLSFSSFGMKFIGANNLALW